MRVSGPVEVVWYVPSPVTGITPLSASGAPVQSTPLQLPADGVTGPYSAHAIEPDVGAPVLLPGVMSVPLSTMVSSVLSFPLLTDGATVVESAGWSVFTRKASLGVLGATTTIVVPGKEIPETVSDQP